MADMAGEASRQSLYPLQRKDISAMWTNIIDGTAGTFCRSLHGLAGHFPSACQVDAGRPALYLALVCALVVAFVAKKMFERSRRLSS